MKRYITIIVLLWLGVICPYSCATYRQEMLFDGGMEEMIHNAIIDFTHTESGLLSKDAYFHVFAIDSHRVCIIGDPNKISLMVEVPDKTNMSEVWNDNKYILLDTVQNKIALVVDWSRSEENPYIWFDESLIQKSYQAFPDDVFVFKDKLFFWKNTSQSMVDDKVIKTLYRYNFVDTLVDKVFWPIDVIDDSKKGKVYYFSNNDLRKYSKRSSHHIH